MRADSRALSLGASLRTLPSVDTIRSTGPTKCGSRVPRSAQAFLYNTHASRRVKLSLLILLLGLAVATVSDVQLNAPGFVLGMLAVLTTTVFQIWQGSKQKELEVSAVQLQAAVSFWQAVQSLAAAVALENLCVRLPPPLGPETPTECRTALTFVASQRPSGSHVVLLVLLTCLIALGTNFSSFCLIGRTSAITFQVVGHAKTCLVLAGGYLLWPPQDTSQLLDNVLGVSVAMLGCILYGHIKMAEANARHDICDAFCPASLLGFVSDAARYEAIPSKPLGSTKEKPVGSLTASDAKVALRRGPTGGSEPPDPGLVEAGELEERAK